MDTAVDRACEDKSLEVNTHFAAKVNYLWKPIIATHTQSGLEAHQHNILQHTKSRHARLIREDIPV